MTDWIAIINVACSAGLCMITGWVIVTPRVHEGPIVKAGLIMISAGLFGVSLLMPRLAFDEALRPMMHAILIGNLGVVVTAGGMAWRIYQRPDAREVVASLTGWPTLDDQSPHDPIA